MTSDTSARMPFVNAIFLGCVLVYFFDCAPWPRDSEDDTFTDPKASSLYIPDCDNNFEKSFLVF
jgi:hypothetical protein